MEKEVRSLRGSRLPEPDLFLQWGHRKRLRCVKVQVKDEATEKTTFKVDRRVVKADKESPFVLPPSCAGQQHLNRHSRNSESSPLLGMVMKTLGNGDHEKSERQQQVHHQTKVGGGKNGFSAHQDAMMVSTTTTTAAAATTEKKGSNNHSGSNGASGGHHTKETFVWPKFIIALSSKEKEEDFMAMKGTRLPQRPKKRPKSVQRTLNLVSPGSWLCDLSHERYEVREKKTSKKRPRGLKAMGNMDSDSE
ncbi:hypothetical protein EJ110_NYTH30711 [Nymphaea thermarum]|nr:hypothetical protein EJ110_NYTH30711 [Nymphaea thermarum]